MTKDAQFTVVTWFNHGLRTYEVYSVDAVDAFNVAVDQDIQDYPNDPSPFEHVEVMRGHDLIAFRV